MAELAEVTGLTALLETVAEYDRMVAAGADTLFLKDPALLQPIEDGSAAYYAFEYNPSAFNTFGGPRTDEHCCALDENSDPIPKLYVGSVEKWQPVLLALALLRREWVVLGPFHRLGTRGSPRHDRPHRADIGFRLPRRHLRRKASSPAFRRRALVGMRQRSTSHKDTASA